MTPNRKAAAPAWEEGSVTPAVAAAMAALVLLGAFLAGFMSAQAARVQAQAVADLAALAGGHAPSALLVSPPAAQIPCGLAEQIAGENQVELRECFVADGDVWVVVSRHITPVGIPLTVTARARAGPVQAPGP